MANPWDRLHLRMWEATSRRLGRVVVQFGELTTFGMFDRKTEITLDEQVLSLENALTIKTSELGSLAYGDQVTVDGGLYKVRHEPMRMADGLLSIVLLEKIEAVATYLVTLSGLRITTLNNKQLRIL
jgi:urease accessory protein UreH